MTFRNLSMEQRADGTLVIKNIADPMDFYIASSQFFRERRPVKQVPRGKYPETTNGEVRQLAKEWSRLAGQGRRDFAEVEQRREDWKVALAQIAAATTFTDPDLTFPHNEEFWMRWTKRLAIWLGAARAMPSKREMIVDSVKESIKHLPENLGKGATAVAEAGAAVARKAGEVAAAPVRGLFGGLFGKFGTPLLIGAIVVAGIIVVPKLLPKRAQTALPPAGGAS